MKVENGKIRKREDVKREEKETKILKEKLLAILLNVIIIGVSAGLLSFNDPTFWGYVLSFSLMLMVSSCTLTQYYENKKNIENE